jgi:DNA-binding response OmpR family regulator
MPNVYPTVLVVEDNEGIGVVVQSLLESEAYRPLLTTSVPEAIALLQEEEVDLILTDGFSETPDGVFESLAPLLTAADGVPIALMTAHQLATNVVEGSGFCALIAKPFDVDMLLGRVRHCLQRASVTPTKA